MLYIVDSPVVLNDELFHFDDGKKYVTTYRVSQEFRDFRSKSLVENAVKNAVLLVVDPSDKNVGIVEKLAGSIGARLSNADISIIALALEYSEKKEEVTVLTDDYSIQNLLLKLQIPFQSVIRGAVKKFRSFK